MRKYLIWLFALLPVATAGSQEGDEAAPTDPSPSVIKEKVRLWVETLKTKSAEAADWEESKRSLTDLNELRKKEIAQIDELIAAAGTRLTDAEKRKADLEADEVKLRNDRRTMEERVALLEEKIRGQIAIFPATLRDKIPDALTRLEEPVGDAPLQNRFRDVLVVLGAVNQFHHSITVADEMRDLDGEGVKVEVLYLSLAGAWFVDRGLPL